MAMNRHDRGTRRGWSPPAWGTAAGLLLLPAIAMRFPGSGVDWTASDFVVMGALLAAACSACEWARRLSRNAVTRAAWAVAVLGGLFLVWANLAVGLVGDGGNPANLMFMGVVAVAIVAALLARGRPAGMARAMGTTAVLHAGAGVAAVLGGWGAPHDGPLRVAAITAFFLLPWLASAALFGRAAARDRLR